MGGGSVGDGGSAGDGTAVLYVSDLDGTLLTDAQGLSPATLRILNGLVGAGMLFTVATARSPMPAAHVLAGLDLRLPVVCMNGAVVADPSTGEVLRSTALPSALARDLVAARLAAGLNPFVFSIDGRGEHHVYYRGVANPGEREWVQHRLGIGDTRFRLVGDPAGGSEAAYEVAYAEQVLGVTVIDARPRLAALLERAAADPRLYAHLSPDLHLGGFWWLETHHAEANKGAGVAWVARRVGAGRIVCFGDSHNDLPMFAVADEAYAMAGAVAQVRAAATGVIGAHTDDAVALFLRDAAARDAAARDADRL